MRPLDLPLAGTRALIHFPILASLQLPESLICLQIVLQTAYFVIQCRLYLLKNTRIIGIYMNDRLIARTFPGVLNNIVEQVLWHLIASPKIVDNLGHLSGAGGNDGSLGNFNVLFIH